MSALPGADIPYSQDDGGKRARSPGSARNTPLKPLRAGMPGDSGVLVVTRALLPLQSAHEAAGAAGTRHSPRPPWADDSSTPRAHRAARARTHVWNRDVDANTLVMPGLDPGIHQSSHDHFRRRWIASIAERKRRRPSDSYARQ